MSSPQLHRHLAILPALLMVLAIPLMLGIVPRNWFYGVRTPRTLRSDANWYPANRICGIILFAVGAVWLATRLG